MWKYSVNSTKFRLLLFFYNVLLLNIMVKNEKSTRFKITTAVWIMILLGLPITWKLEKIYWYSVEQCVVLNTYLLHKAIWQMKMHRSANFQAPPNALDFLWSCEGVSHKQEVCFILCFLFQFVTWQYNPNLLDSNWLCTVINDHDWQLWWSVHNINKLL